MRDSQERQATWEEYTALIKQSRLPNFPSYLLHVPLPRQSTSLAPKDFDQFELIMGRYAGHSQEGPDLILAIKQNHYIKLLADDLFAGVVRIKEQQF